MTTWIRVSFIVCSVTFVVVAGASRVEAADCKIGWAQIFQQPGHDPIPTTGEQVAPQTYSADANTELQVSATAVTKVITVPQAKTTIEYTCKNDQCTKTCQPKIDVVREDGKVKRATLSCSCK